MKNLNHYVAIYKEQLSKGDILIAYKGLVSFVMKLRVDLIKSMSETYSFSGMLHGYMDYTYFYYMNDFLKDSKLKLGLVLNHKEMQFEIWLLGNTKVIQSRYWEVLKESKWNKGKLKMPEFSILEAIIDASPDFNDLPALSLRLEEKLKNVSEEIINELKGLKQN